MAQVTFSENTWRELEGLARRLNKSVADVLSDAIVLEKWYTDVTTGGGQVMEKRPDGTVRPVTITQA
jgi:hypothetical protein